MELNIICTTVSAEVMLSFSTHSCVIYVNSWRNTTRRNCGSTVSISRGRFKEVVAVTYNGTIFRPQVESKPFCSPSRRGVPITVAHSLTCNISPPLLLILSGFCDVKMPIIHINYTCFIIRESDYDLAKRIQMDVSVLFIN